ncbi:MAG: methyltransferase domain-containing protein [Rhodocyclaceae bacterium]|nr:methyltransferase domain-containing protein [Rhodocyclaceae bacterium]
MTNANKTTVRLNLGCGSKRRDGFFGVDRFPCAGADMLCDLARPLPFAESSVEAFFLDNVIEHIQDIPSLVAELVRVGKPGARITIVTPHFTSLSSWRDPTHVHHLSYFSFDHFAKPSTRHYTGGGLDILERDLSFGGGVLGILGRLLFRISPEKYERKYCFVFRASTLRFELEVVKC